MNTRTQRNIVKSSCFSFLMIALVALSLIGPASSALAEHGLASAPKGLAMNGSVDKVTFSAIADPTVAIQQLQSGAIDMYAVAVSDTGLLNQVQSSPDLTYASSYGANNQLLFNASSCNDTTMLNPFTNMKIREAMNWVVDRNYIVSTMFNGMAEPKYTALTAAFPDAARYASLLSGVKSQYGYDFNKAKQVVDTEMTAMGATLDANNKWQYQGKPVTIIGLIRVEDQRLAIGRYFADQLEALGFTVTRLEKTRSEASLIWAQSYGNECKFNYYTAGWINSNVLRDEGLVFAEFNSSRVQNIPIFMDYKPSKELSDAEDALLTNNFKTMSERGQLFQTAINLSMKESWWGVWVVDTAGFSPYRTVLTGSADLAGGFGGSDVLPYTLRFNNQTGGEAKIAQSDLMVAPWNPISGSNWTDDVMIQKFTADWGTIYDPYSGLKMAKLVQKAELTAKWGLPITNTLDWVTLKFADNIPVPDDAWADWDATNQRWITAAERAQTDPNYRKTSNVRSVVVYEPSLWQTRWHDGSTVSVGDFVINMIMQFDPTKPASKIYDQSYYPTIGGLKGIKILSTNPLTIETYSDQYSLDAENSVYTWYPNYAYGTAGWHNLAPAIAAEAAGQLAFSTDKSIAKGVQMTNFIDGPSLGILSTQLNELAASSALPYAPTLGQYVTPAEIAARYASLQAWYAAKGHFWLGTGPYYIDQILPAEGKVVLSRFADYQPTPCAGVTEIPRAECDALVALYYGASGRNWKSAVNWLVTNTPSNWEGVTVANGHVVGLALVDHLLEGAIPAEMGSLAGLQTLNLSSNRLYGPIPDALANLTGLSDLSLDYNRLDVPNPYPADPPTALHAFLLPRDPDWQLTQSVSTVIPSEGADLTSRDGEVTASVPAGAADGQTALEFLPENVPSQESMALTFAGSSFKLVALDQNNSPIEGYVFNNPITLSLHYTDQDAAGIDENELLIYYFDKSAQRWKDASTTCSPTSSYQRDLESNTLTVEICHLTEFGLFKAPDTMYLPFVNR